MAENSYYGKFSPNDIELMKNRFFKIVKYRKNMSELRSEIETAIRTHLAEEGIAEWNDFDATIPVVNYNLTDEQQLNLLMYIEKAWKIHFTENATLEFAKNVHKGSIHDLITVIIQAMNREH